MKRLLTLTLFSIMFFALTLAVVKEWSGNASTSLAALILNARGCAQPCWHGIQPGKTTFQEGQVLLQTDTHFIAHLGNGQQDHIAGPEKNLCWLVMVNPIWHGCASRDEFSEGPIMRVDILPSRIVPMRLGEALAIFGTPVASTVCLQANAEYAAVYFADNVSVITLLTEPSQPSLDPNTPVYVVRYEYPSSEPPYRFDTPPWRGFIQWRGLPGC